MNATARGVNLGLYEKGKEQGMEPGLNSAQPHVDLMGRRMWVLFSVIRPVELTVINIDRYTKLKMSSGER
jgi:hypothetical protein